MKYDLKVFADGFFEKAFKGVTLPPNDPNKMLQNGLNTAFAAAGLVAVGFIIYGGIMYMTSAGDPNKVKKATNALLYSIIGLAVVILAAAIVNFVLGSVGGSTS